MKLVLVALVLGAVAVGWRPPTASAPAQAQTPLARGADLYLEECQSCHLATGLGQPSLGIPSLHGVGAASVDFYLATGRMPAANNAHQATRKPVSVDAADRQALITYVTSTWPGGPDVPNLGLAFADLAGGGDLYRTNCAACHGAAGAGAALAYGAFAPSLHAATATEIAEAARVGPGNMPVFGPDALTNAQLAEIVRYVLYLHHPDDRGGLGLGHTGPIAEGFVGLLALAFVALAAWVGDRQPGELADDA